jgi:hypothetical protein
MTETLAEKTCTPCRGGIPPLTREEAERFRDGEALARYSRRSTVPGLRRGKQDLTARTLTPSILVRIQVPQPRILPISPHIFGFGNRWNSHGISVG